MSIVEADLLARGFREDEGAWMKRRGERCREQSRICEVSSERRNARIHSSRRASVQISQGRWE